MRSRPLPWKRTKTEARELAALDPDKQQWLEREVEKRRRVAGLKCSVCGQPAALVRVRIIPPPRAHELGAPPDKALIVIGHFCVRHDDHIGYVEFEQALLQSVQEQRTTHHAGSGRDHLIAFD